MISSFVYRMAPVYLVTITFFQKTQSVIAAPLIISHIVCLSPDPSYLYNILITRNDSINKAENNNLFELKPPVLAKLNLVVALFYALGACRLANNSTPPAFFLCGWLAG